MAKDPVKVAPKAFKILLENDRVRVLDYRAPSPCHFPGGF